MHYLPTSEPHAHMAVKEALEGGLWIIGCTTGEDPNDYSGFVLENVFRYESDGFWAKKYGHAVLISYGISAAIEDGYLYRIHDDYMTLDISNSLDTYVQGITSTYGAVMIDEGAVDRRRVYGKLGTEHVDEVVFINDLPTA